MRAENEQSASPRRKWLGIRCSHGTCVRYGICLVGPPLPSERVVPTATRCPTCIHPEGYDRLSGPCPTCCGEGEIESFRPERGAE